MIPIKKNSNKIIIHCPNPLGDFIMALPAMECIAGAFQNSHLTLMMKPGYSPLVSGMDWYDNVIGYDKSIQSGIKGFLKTVEAIRRKGYDLGVMFTNSFDSALMMFLAGVKVRVGYVRYWRGPLLTRGLKPMMREGRIEPQPMVDYYGNISHFLGCGTAGRAPRLILTEEEKKAGAKFLMSRGIDPEAPLLGLVPGAGYGKAKMWPEEYFAEAGDELARRTDAMPVIFAQAKDAVIAKKIGHKMTHKPLDMSCEKNSLALLKQLVGHCALVLTTDSGPRHIAQALRIPVVVVMGSADPIYSFTENERVAVERVPVECSACMLRDCPTDHRCMTLLRPEQVVESAMKLVKIY